MFTDGQQTILKLKKAKTAHLRWRTYAEAMVAGVDDTVDQLPVKHTDCEFGQWYHAQAEEFTALELFRQIGEIHQGLHNEFEIIFNLLVVGNERIEKAGFFAKMLGRKLSAGQGNKQQASHHLNKLKAISGLMIEKLDELIVYIENNT